MSCKSCVYKDGILVKLCGLCEAKEIEARIKWWQDGKKRLNKNEKRSYKPYNRQGRPQ